MTMIEKAPGMPILAMVLALFLSAGIAHAADPVFPPGLRVGMTPPGAMKPNGALHGFEDRDAQAVLLIAEMPLPAYAELETGLTAANLEKQGLHEDKREDLALAGGKGILISAHQQADGKTLRKWVLLAAMPDMTAMIALQAPEGNAVYTDDSVRAAFATITMRTSVPVEELLSLVPIAFDDLSGMRPIRVAPPGVVFLTDGPKDTMQAAEQPLLAVALGMGGPESNSDRDNFARNMLGDLIELKETRILSRDMLRLGASPTHEIQAEGKDAKTGTPMKLVQWIRFGNGGFVRIVGMARADVWQEAFPHFRGVRDGIKPR